MCSWWVCAESLESFCPNWFSFFHKSCLIFQNSKNFNLFHMKYFWNHQKVFSWPRIKINEYPNACNCPYFHKKEFGDFFFLGLIYRRPPSFINLILLIFINDINYMVYSSWPLKAPLQLLPKRRFSTGQGGFNHRLLA